MAADLARQQQQFGNQLAAQSQGSGMGKQAPPADQEMRGLGRNGP